MDLRAQPRVGSAGGRGGFRSLTSPSGNGAGRTEEGPPSPGAPRWGRGKLNYAIVTRGDSSAAISDLPSVIAGRRLILWRPPGTGKTSALSARSKLSGAPLLERMFETHATSNKR